MYKILFLLYTLYILGLLNLHVTVFAYPFALVKKLDQTGKM